MISWIIGAMITLSFLLQERMTTKKQMPWYLPFLTVVLWPFFVGAIIYEFVSVFKEDK